MPQIWASQGYILIYYFISCVWAVPSCLFVSVACFCWKVDISNNMATLKIRFPSLSRIWYFCSLLLFVCLLTFLNKFCEVCILCHMWLLKPLFSYLSGWLIFNRDFLKCWGTLSLSVFAERIYVHVEVHLQHTARKSAFLHFLHAYKGQPEVKDYGLLIYFL